jgi:hypothetical protein
MFPVPEDAKPTAELSFVQLYEEELLLPLKLIAVVAVPMQNNLLPGFVTVGIGFIVAKTAVLGDEQPLAVTLA